MSETILLNNVLGTDGEAPIIDPTTFFWQKSQIYVGREGKHKYIPKVNDLVFDVPMGTIEYVADLNSLYIPRLVPWNYVQAVPDEDDGQSSLIGVGSGCAQTVRLLVNKTNAPYECVVDQRWTFGGLHARYARVYRGSPTDAVPQVISMVYDSSNNFITHDVPLETVSIEDVTNVAQKTVRPFRTTYDLKQGESLTIVIYGEEGTPVADYRLVVQEKGWFIGNSVKTRYVTDLTLESWLIKPSEPNVIELPINLTVNSINAIGVVHYSDGSVKRFPALGDRFSIMGMNNFVATLSNEKTQVDLRYEFAPNEISYDSNEFNERFMTRPYFIQTGQARNAYSVRLFCYPTWIDAVNGYRLEWFLANLDRQVIYNVTQHVVYNTETNPSFNPRAYGMVQELSVSVNLRDVSSIFHSHRHTQVVNVELAKQGTETPTLWRISDYGSLDYFGIELQARYIYVNQNLKRIRFDTGALTKEEWLNRLYRMTHPIHDRFSEAKAPDPNYFIVEIPGQPGTLEYKVEDWNKEFTTAMALTPDSTIYLKFVLRTNDGDQLLSIAGMPLKQVTDFN